MTGRYLLDTNIVIALFNADSAVAARLAAAPEVFVPAPVLGELYFGVQHSGRPRANSERIDAFAAESTIVAIDAAVARAYGELKGELRRSGRPIPENDLWIGACALVHGLELVSRDRHFEQLDRIRVEVW